MSLLSTVVKGVKAVATGGTSILADWRMWAVIIMISSIGFLGIQSEYRKGEVITLQGKVTQLHADVAAVNQALATSRMADVLATGRQKARDANNVRINTLIGNTSNDKDGNVSPVLRDVLAGLGGSVQQPAANPVRHSHGARKPPDVPSWADEPVRD